MTEQADAQDQLESSTNEETLQTEVTAAEGEQQTEQLETEAVEGQDSSFIPPDETGDRVQKRINQLTYEKNEALRQQQAMQARMDKIEANQQAAAVSQGEPTLDQFDYDESKYNAALIDHKVKEQMQQFTANQQQSTQQVQQQAAVTDFQTKQRDFAAKDAEYVELVQTVSGAITSPVIEQFIIGSNDGLKMHKALLKNVAEVQRIQQLPEWQQGAELAKLEVKLSNVKTKQKSKAPTPANTVNASSNTTTGGKLKGAARNFEMPR